MGVMDTSYASAASATAVAGQSEQENESLTRALIELDSAWEAHAQVKTELDRKTVMVRELNRHVRITRPRVEGFEKISTAIWPWLNSSPEAREVNATITLNKISDIINKARAEVEKIAEAQRKSKEA